MDVDAVLARGRRWPWSTSSPTPTCRARATPSAGRTSRSCWTRASTCCPRSTCSTCRASTTSSSGSPASPAGDRAGRGRPPRRTARAGRHHAGGAAAAARPRQRLPGRAHRRRARQLLPARQPHRAARAGAALGGRPGRRRAAALPRRAERSPTRGRRANASSSPSPAAPESETLIRRGSRIATRAGAELQVVHILRGDGLPGCGRPRWSAAGLAEEVGATFHTVVGDDVPTALLDFARGVNATQLVIGTSRRSRWRGCSTRASAPGSVQQSGSIDVHMVTHSEAGGRLRGRARREPARVLAAGRGVGARCRAAGAGHRRRRLLPGRLDFATDVISYVGHGGRGAGRRPRAGAGRGRAVGAGLLNFFFTPPLYTLTVAHAGRTS